MLINLKNKKLMLEQALLFVELFEVVLSHQCPMGEQIEDEPSSNTSIF